jgi:gliding motility-associated-like protein
VNPSAVRYLDAGIKNINLTVSNQFCSENASGTIQIDTTPVAAIVTSSPICSGDSLQLGVNGIQPNGAAYSYTWNFSGNPIFNSGNWKVMYPDAGIESVQLILGIGNCYDSTEASVVIHKTPDAGIISTAPVCQGLAVDFLNSGSSGSRWDYQWDFGSAAFPSASTAENPSNIRFKTPGINKILFRIGDVYCYNLDSAFIQINDLPEAQAGLDTIICADDCISLGSQPQTGNTYKWFPALGLDDASSATPEACPAAEFSQYVLTVSNDTSGCIAADTVLITMLSSALADAGEDVEVCIGDSVQIGSAAVEGQTYIWAPTDGLDNANASSPMVSPLAEKVTYTLTVSYKNCDAITDEVTVIRREAVADAGEDITIALGEKAELNASGGILYKWTPFENMSNPMTHNPVVHPEETTVYIVEVTDVFNCQDKDSVKVSVVNPAIFVPSAFTPDGSGRNDVFRVRGNPLSQFEMTIFNRSGEVVFYSKEFYAAWNGADQQSGKVLAAGAYIYRIRGFDELGEEIVLSGMVNLIR